MAISKKKINEILRVLQQDLKAADQKRKELDGQIDTWKSEYNGERYGNEVKGKSEIVSRDIKKHSEWQHANIIDPFVSNPDVIKCNPVTWEDRDAAQQTETVLNTQFCNQFNRYNFMTKAVKVLDQEGTAVIMTSWEYEESVVEIEVPTIEFINGIPTITGSTPTEQLVITKNQPSAKVVRNEDVWIDPTCQDDMDNCQFVIYRYETDMSTLKADGRYKNLSKIRGENDDPDYDAEDDTEFEFSDKARKKIIVHEYWGNYDIDDDGEVEAIVCAWVGNVCIRLEENPYPDKKPPFLVVPFNSVPFQLYGEANAELLSDVQKVKTAIMRGFIDNMAQSNNAQTGIRKGALDITNRRRYMKGENFEFNGTPSDFWQGNYNQLPSSAFDVLALMNNEGESLTGNKAFSQGITGNSLGATATGARGAMDATAVRRLNIVRNISENLIKPLMRKWRAYNSEFLQDVEVMRITEEEFVEIRRDDLEGRIDINISVSTSEDNAAKAQELAFMLQTIGPNEDPSIRKMIMSEIARLQKMPDLAKKLEEYEPQPDPIQQELELLQVELLRAQVQNERAKAGENAVDIQLKSAKTENELAKARNLHSKSDQQDLDFLKDESGVSRDREMEDKEFDRLSKLDQEALKLQGKK